MRDRWCGLTPLPRRFCVICQVLLEREKKSVRYSLKSFKISKEVLQLTRERERKKEGSGRHVAARRFPARRQRLAQCGRKYSSTVAGSAGPGRDLRHRRELVCKVSECFKIVNPGQFSSGQRIQTCVQQNSAPADLQLSSADRITE